MASLSVRKIDDDIYRMLKRRAAEHGLSIEEEVRQIIRRAVEAPTDLGQFALECFGSAHGAKLEPLPREPHEPLDLSE